MDPRPLRPSALTAGQTDFAHALEGLEPRTLMTAATSLPHWNPSITRAQIEEFMNSSDLEDLQTSSATSDDDMYAFNRIAQIKREAVVEVSTDDEQSYADLDWSDSYIDDAADQSRTRGLVSSKPVVLGRDDRALNDLSWARDRDPAETIAAEHRDASVLPAIVAAAHVKPGEAIAILPDAVKPDDDQDSDEKSSWTGGEESVIIRSDFTSR